MTENVSAIIGVWIATQVGYFFFWKFAVWEGGSVDLECSVSRAIRAISRGSVHELFPFRHIFACLGGANRVGDEVATPRLLVYLLQFSKYSEGVVSTCLFSQIFKSFGIT